MYVWSIPGRTCGISPDVRVETAQTYMWEYLFMHKDKAN